MQRVRKAAMTPLQADRLDRIIESTKALLAEKDAEQLTMRDIARASQVAEGTLYNRFGSKDRLITLAIVDYFERSVLSQLELPSRKSPAQRVLHGIDVVLASILQSQSFARALMGSYFKIGNDREMPERLAELVRASWTPLLREMQAARSLQPWVSLPLLGTDLCERELATVARWARGEIRDEQLRDQLRFALLSPLLSASRGAQVREITGLLETTVRRLDPATLPLKPAAARPRPGSSRR